MQRIKSRLLVDYLKSLKIPLLRVLRVAFLSALVLELVSTISTALIAVYLGLTLLDGEVTFFSAFFILLLASGVLYSI